MSITNKILFIQNTADEKFRLILNEDWGSNHDNYRQKIRSFLSERMSMHFSREQLVQLSDLNRRPQGSDRQFSISHCLSLGGFAVSQYKVGFDVEVNSRISTEILKRVSTEQELQEAPQTEYLWVAKEAAFKALSNEVEPLVISDLICSEWQSYFENQIFGFRIKSKKTLDLNHNKGFIFSEGPCLIGLFFQ